MEIDIRQIPEGDRLSRVLSAARSIGAREVLTLLAGEDPTGLVESAKAVLGRKVDTQILRWGTADLPWVVHLKRA